MPNMRGNGTHFDCERLFFKQSKFYEVENSTSLMPGLGRTTPRLYAECSNRWATVMFPVLGLGYCSGDIDIFYFICMKEDWSTMLNMYCTSNMNKNEINGLKWSYKITSIMLAVDNYNSDTTTHHHKQCSLLQLYTLGKKGGYTPIEDNKTNVDRTFVFPLGWNWHDMDPWLFPNEIRHYLGQTFNARSSGIVELRNHSIGGRSPKSIFTLWQLWINICIFSQKFFWLFEQCPVQPLWVLGMRCLHLPVNARCYCCPCGFDSCYRQPHTQKACCHWIFGARQVFRGSPKDNTSATHSCIVWRHNTYSNCVTSQCWCVLSQL